MPSEQFDPLGGAEKHTFITVTQCDLCDCHIAVKESVGVTVPAGSERDMAINAFRGSMSIMLSDQPICSECEDQLVALFGHELHENDE